MAKKKAPGTPEDPTDHSKSATSIAASVDPSGKSGATVNATSMDTVSKEDKAKEDKKALEEDQSLAGKILRSGLFFVRDHSTGEDYVGVSPQNNPDASTASKLRSAVTPLGAVPPRTGMIIRPKDGDAFTIGEGFGPDSTPDRWAGVSSPDGKPLFG
jgi:hypothetical protein